MSICILGDLHFNSSKDYYVQVGEEFIKWFHGWVKNDPENELILAGDLVNTSIDGGIVIDQLVKMFNLSRFSKVHIVVGNHDIKRKDGIEQLAYKFLRQRENIAIYEREQVVKIQGKQVLLLPHYNPTTSEESMSKRYSKLHEIYDGLDLTVGHFAEERYGGFGSDKIKNIEKLDTKYLCLGHIHIRTNPKIYIGSVYSTRVGEQDDRRAAWVLDSDGKLTFDRLPVFCDFVTVEYPNPLPSTPAEVPVYTITNCSSDKIARLQYGDSIFIRKTLRGLDAKKVIGDKGVQRLGLQDLDVKSLFKVFLKEYPGSLDRSAAAICQRLLTTN